jgi:hypothetical protein
MARDGETLTASIHRAGGVWNAEQTAIANGIEATRGLEPGRPVKLPVRESYRSSSDRAASHTDRVESHTGRAASHRLAYTPRTALNRKPAMLPR